MAKRNKVNVGQVGLDGFDGGSVVGCSPVVPLSAPFCPMMPSPRPRYGSRWEERLELARRCVPPVGYRGKKVVK